MVLLRLEKFNGIDKADAPNRRFLSAGRIQRGITRVVVVGFSLIAWKLPAVSESYRRLKIC